ncbi:MAG: hypothetical protein HOP95_01830 [Sphingomonas sp.]|nr:hypothetical protein [Sphingomonas sp.]
MRPEDAARVVIETITQMAAEGRPLMQRILPQDDIHWWAHYPEDDARDAVTRSRYYYHVHEPGDRNPDEHGHFHLFLHRRQMDRGAIPIAEPAEGEKAPALMVHIAGLSIDHRGIPIAWFTTNRWVTDEFMYPATTLAAHLDRYNVDSCGEDPLVNRFLTAMVALYRDELSELLAARDARLAEIGAGPAAEELFESGNDVLSTLSIDLDAKVASLDL